MVALLLAVALIGVIVLALLIAGAVVAAVIGVLVFNVLVVVLTLRRRPARSSAVPAAHARVERWQPSSFRHPPTPPSEAPGESADPTAVPGDPAAGTRPVGSRPTFRAHRL
jgi:hypothetical protein